jgi:hypothetical protein
MLLYEECAVWPKVYKPTEDSNVSLVLQVHSENLNVISLRAPYFNERVAGVCKIFGAGI